MTKNIPAKNIWDELLAVFSGEVSSFQLFDSISAWLKLQRTLVLAISCVFPGKNVHSSVELIFKTNIHTFLSLVLSFPVVIITKVFQRQVIS